MKALKYIILFIYAFVFFAIVLNNFIPINFYLAISSALLAAIGFYMLKKYMVLLPLNKLLLLGVFLLLITGPLVGKKETDSLEKRDLASFPEFHISNIWKFFFGYQTYFEDHFAFRNEFLRWNGLTRLHFFKSSPVPQKMEFGKDEWLFASGTNFIEFTSKPFSQDELKLISLNLEIMTKWFADKKVKYYFACLPIKARIYPEKLTDLMSKQLEFSRLNQLYDYLKGNDKINFIDARYELIEGRKTRDTYIKSDTHWNTFGAYLGYRKIMQTMQKDFPDLVYYNLSDYRIDTVETQGGDLLMFMGLTEGIKFNNYKFNLLSGKEAKSVTPPTGPKHNKRTYVSELQKSPNKYKLFVVRDSYSEFLKLFTSNSFERVFYDWRPIPEISNIAAEKPDIVLHEMLERFILYTLILPPEIKNDSTFINSNFPEYYQFSSKVDVSQIVVIENP